MEREAKRRDDFEALEEIKRRLAVNDPEILCAVDEADRALIQSQLGRSPLERLRMGIDFAQSLSRFGRADDIRD
jgi:hypothetical protein